MTILPETPLRRRLPLRPRLVITTVVAVLVVVGAGAGVVALHRGSAPPVLTRAQAERVLNQYWPLHENALVSKDLSTLATLSTGAAQRWEQAVVSCGCLQVTAPRPLVGAEYFVPRQAHYPASFVAEAETTADGQYWFAVLTFRKQNVRAPWLVVEDSEEVPPAGSLPSLDTPATDSHGFDQSVATTQRARAQQVVNDFVRLWRESKDDGIAPPSSEFVLTGLTGERLADLAMFRQDHRQINGLYGHFQFSTSPSDPLIEVTEKNGGDLACQPIRETVTYTPPAGQVIYQDPSRHLWGLELAPGKYQQLTSTDVWQTCFEIPPNSDDPITVLNHPDGGALRTGILSTRSA